MATQVTNGKAFEYALIQELYERLSPLTKVSIKDDEPFKKTKSCYDSFNEKKQQEFTITASFAINFLIDIEPRLSVGISIQDILILSIVSDKAGQTGDVRDVLLIRSVQKWEIGISAKNNHHALKHSRLSPKLNFGKKWIDSSCSQTYFDEINVVFDEIKHYKSLDKTTEWDEVYSDKTKQIYEPILKAFKKELLSLQENDKKNFANDLVQYLIGNEDFYKIIKGRNKVEIHAFNLNGTLNLSAKGKKPKGKITKIKLPSRLIEVVFKKGHHNTLIAYFDKGWQISFRLHSAEKTVVPTLKFDVALVSAPYNLFSNHILINN